MTTDRPRTERSFAVNWPSRLPLWWRFVAWIAICGGTAYLAPTLWRQLAAGAAMVIAAVAFQATFREDRAGSANAVTMTPVPGVGNLLLAPGSFRGDRQGRANSTSLAIVFGLAAILLAPNGLGYVPPLLAAGRVPFSYSPRTVRIVVVLETLAFGLAVGWVSRSLTGLLAGFGVPVLVQRAAERQELINERNRAEALLAEVEAGRAAEATAAALRERGRIARDMHDVLAHSLAGLSLQLQAARAVATKAGAAPEVIAPIDRAAELARSGLDEARSAVSALREPLALEGLPSLVERYGATLTISGEPARVSAEAGNAVYRAVQEALTNAARYAPGSPVTVTVDWSSTLAVTITDQGTDQPVPAAQGTGFGLDGMGERVVAAGGRLRAGPRPTRGWQVELSLPIQEPT